MGLQVELGLKGVEALTPAPGPMSFFFIRPNGRAYPSPTGKKSGICRIENGVAPSPSTRHWFQSEIQGATRDRRPKVT